MSEFLSSFGSDVRTVTLFLLIIIDLVMGIIFALRHNVFSFHKVAQFYWTNVIPFILGYFLIFTITFYGLTEYIDEPLVSEVISQVTATVGWFPGILKLSHSIKQKLDHP